VDIVRVKAVVDKATVIPVEKYTPISVKFQSKLNGFSPLPYDRQNESYGVAPLDGKDVVLWICKKVYPSVVGGTNMPCRPST
jgi:hypothetical protein